MVDSIDRTEVVSATSTSPDSDSGKVEEMSLLLENIHTGIRHVVYPRDQVNTPSSSVLGTAICGIALQQLLYSRVKDPISSRNRICKRCLRMEKMRSSDRGKKKDVGPTSRYGY